MNLKYHSLEAKLIEHPSSPTQPARTITAATPFTETANAASQGLSMKRPISCRLPPAQRQRLWTKAPSIIHGSSMPTVFEIQKACAEAAGVPVTAIVSRDRHESAVMARHCAILLVYELGLAKHGMKGLVASWFSRSLRSIHYSRKESACRLSIDPAFRLVYEKAREGLTQTG